MGLYENIKDAASKKGLTISQIEKDLDLPRSSISKYNKNTPGADKVQRIAEYLDVTSDFLLTGKKEIFEEDLYRLAAYAVMLHDLEQLDEEHRRMAAKYISWLLYDQKEGGNGESN